MRMPDIASPSREFHGKPGQSPGTSGGRRNCLPSLSSSRMSQNKVPGGEGDVRFPPPVAVVAGNPLAPWDFPSVPSPRLPLARPSPKAEDDSGKQPTDREQRPGWR